MRCDIDAYTVANEVALMRDGYRGTVFMVEGDDDARLMDKFMIREDRCRLIVAYGKENALSALAILRQRGLGYHLLVMVDADYWRLTGDMPNDRDIVTTDFHDLEIDVCMSEALNSLLAEVADDTAVRKLEARQRASLRDVVLRQLQTLSVVRYANALGGLYLNFRAVELENFIDDDTADIDVDAYLTAVLEKSHPGISLAEVVGTVGLTTIRDVDLPHAVRGHDFTALVGKYLRKVIGQCAPVIGCRTHVETLLRLGYAREHLERTGLHASILEWEEDTGGSILA